MILTEFLRYSYQNWISKELYNLFDDGFIGVGRIQKFHLCYLLNEISRYPPPFTKDTRSVKYLMTKLFESLNFMFDPSLLEIRLVKIKHSEYFVQNTWINLSSENNFEKKDWSKVISYNRNCKVYFTYYNWQEKIGWFTDLVHTTFHWQFKL